MVPRRRSCVCRDCRWCRLRSAAPTESGYYCEARARLVDRADLDLRGCDKFESWRSPAER